MLRPPHAKLAVSEPRVAVITLDRPDRRNAVDHQMLVDLFEIQRSLTELIDAAEVRAVVMTGTSPAFSAGADLNGVEAGQFANDLTAVLEGFTRLGAPVIAAIDGPALGAGTQLALAADLRVATPESPLGVPAAKLGLAVDEWTVQRAMSEFSAPVARAMLIAAENYSAERLHQLGGVHRLGDLDVAMDWAASLARLAPLTMRAHKLGLEGDGGFGAARAAAWESDDAEEGRTAFLEKRRPDFAGR